MPSTGSGVPRERGVARRALAGGVVAMGAIWGASSFVAWPPAANDDVSADVRDPDVDLRASVDGATVEGVFTAVGSDTASCAEALGAGTRCSVVSLSGGHPASSVSLLGDTSVVVVLGGRMERRELPGGQIAWRTQVFDQALPTTTWYDDGFLVAANREAVVRLEPAAGSIVWRAEPAHPAAGPPQLWLGSAGLLALYSPARLTLHDLEDGSVRWSRAAQDPSMEGVGPVEPERRDDRERTIRPPMEPGGVDVPGQLPPELGSVRLLPGDRDEEVVVVAHDRHGGRVWVSGTTRLDPGTQRAVQGGPGRLVIAAEQRSGLVLDASTGELLADLRSPEGVLRGVVADVALWRVDGILVGRRWSDGADVLQATGDVVSIDPLIVNGPTGVVHVTFR